jgi:hypothetical protein
MEHVIAGYLRQVWDTSTRKWLFEGQRGFGMGNSYESQIVTFCHDIAYSLDEGDRIGAIIIDFSKVIDFVPYDRMLTKVSASGVDSRVVVWVRKFL